MNKAVFLDRDGTICRDEGYLINFTDFSPLEGALDALKIFQDLGFLLFIVTNQSGVARGYFSEAQVLDLNGKIEKFLEQNGIRITETVFCPHYEGGTVAEYAVACPCRKPGPGMLDYLRKKYTLDVSQSYMAGDKWSDVRAGLAAGAHPVKIGTADLLKAPQDAAAPGFDRLLDFALALKQDLIIPNP